MILVTSVIQIQNFKLVYPTSKSKAKTPNPKNIGLAWVLHMVDHFVAAVYEGGPVRALDFGFRIKKIWSLDFGDNKTAIFGTLQPFFLEALCIPVSQPTFLGGSESAAGFDARKSSSTSMTCLRSICKSMVARPEICDFFFIGNSCRFVIRGVWQLLLSFFFKNVRFPWMQTWSLNLEEFMGWAPSVVAWNDQWPSYEDLVALNRVFIRDKFLEKGIWNQVHLKKIPTLLSKSFGSKNVFSFGPKKWGPQLSIRQGKKKGEKFGVSEHQDTEDSHLSCGCIP